MPSIGKKQGIEGARLINCVTKAIVNSVMNSIAPSHTEDDATAQEVGAPLTLSENTPSWKTALAEERSKEYFPSARLGTPPDTGSEHVGFRCAKSSI